MNFYEFNDYGYYALILAKSEECALRIYDENVSELDEDEKHLSPRHLTEHEALKVFLKSKIEHCNTKEEKESEFYKWINECKNDQEYFEYGSIFLIDGSLC